jgi:hypothetical protein
MATSLSQLNGHINMQHSQFARQNPKPWSAGDHGLVALLPPLLVSVQAAWPHFPGGRQVRILPGAPSAPHVKACFRSILDRRAKNVPNGHSKPRDAGKP